MPFTVLVVGTDGQIERGNAAWDRSATAQLVSLPNGGIGSRYVDVLASVVQAGDDAATDALLALSRDGDASVKATALSSLGQVGSARAVDALVSAAGGGAAEDRIAALQGLGNVDDPRASATLARAIEERDDSVATAAIWAAYNGGDDVDQALVRAFANPAASDAVRNAAGQQIRSRGIDVDDATRAKLDEVLGASYGGYGYGGYGGE